LRKKQHFNEQSYNKQYILSTWIVNCFKD